MAEDVNVVLNLNKKAIPDTWIPLDNQSTVDVFSNPKVLSNIHMVKGSLKTHTQAGMTTTKLRGHLKGHEHAWCCEKDIANILSLSNMKKTHRVTLTATAAINL